MSTESRVDSAVADVRNQIGRIDILVNNAGINTAIQRVNIDRYPFEEWERIAKIDLTGTYSIRKAAARVMIKHRDGRIINFASVMGVIPAQ